MDFQSSLFWYKPIFMMELLIAEALSSYKLEKRKHFAIKAPIFIIASLLFSFLFPIFSFSYNAIYTSFMFLFFFAVTLFEMKLLYDADMTKILFCGILAYTTQHISYEIYNYIVSIIGLSDFGGAYIQGLMKYNILTLLVYLATYGVVYWFIWAFVDYKINFNNKMKINKVSLLSIAAIIVVITIVLNVIVTYSHTTDKIIQTVIFIYSILSCFLAVSIQFYLISLQNTRDENEMIKQLWATDKRQYELSKKNIELINIKCHDLKHQVKLLRHSMNKDVDNELKEIESAINIYDSSLKTGCDVLDVILTEKSLYCDAHNITLSCIVDGKELSFLDSIDVYSLFSNAISNAIEAEEKIGKGDRFIHLKVYRRGDLLAIHIENRIVDKPIIKEGIYITSKNDKDYHGFGIKSMQMITDKYQGALSIKIEDELFNLDIIIPIDQTMREVRQSVQEK